MVIKIKKKKKSVRMRGTNSHGGGARGKRRGSGHRGGFGMAGTGKKADHKKSLVLKKYGNKYFGKQGITSRGTLRRKLKAINLREIQINLNSLMKRFGKGTVLDLKNYKILGDGELKRKLDIKAHAFTKSAKEKIEKLGGKAVVKEVKENKVDKKTTNNAKTETATQKSEKPTEDIKDNKIKENIKNG
tara:strand:+ start:9621 stop:10184 length:564 start_codon:yes stop_codon:yes gene_type:complete